MNKSALTARLTAGLAWLRKRWWIPALLGVAVLLGVLSHQEKPFTAEVATVARGEVRQSVLEEGKTRLNQEYVLTLPVAGEIPRLGLEVGDWVQRGQPLLTLRRYAREQELAGLAAQQRELLARQQGVVTQQPSREDEAAAQSRIRAAEANLIALHQQQAAQTAELAQLERDASRQQRLQAEGASTVAQLEAIRKQVEVLRHQLAAAAAQQRSGRESLIQAQAELAKLGRTRRDQAYLHRVYAAEADQLRSQQALKQDELQHTVLRAPVAGPVLEVYAPNAGLQPAGAQILRLGDPHSLMVETDLLSEDVPAIHIGQRAELLGKALGDQPAIGSVARIYPSGFTKLSALGVEQQRIKVLVKAPDLQLRPGTRLDVRIITAQRPQAIRIPERALFKQDNLWQVYKLDATRHARLQPVTVGLRNEDWAEITHGLQPGDRIITQLENALKPGLPIVAASGSPAP